MEMSRSNSKRTGMEFEKELKEILRPYFDEFAQTPYGIFDYIGRLGSYLYVIEAKVVSYHKEKRRFYIHINRVNSRFVRLLARDKYVLPVLIMKVNGEIKVITGLKIWDFLGKGDQINTSVGIKGWLDYAIPLDKWLAKLKGIRAKIKARKGKK